VADASEFAALYERYAADVYRFALYLSGDRGEAEDITSETFTRAWTAPGPIVTATVKGYLFTIARNLFLHGRRAASRAVAVDETLRDPAAPPDVRAEQRAALDAVRARLRTLPAPDRAALLMYAVGGMPYEEIARALGISLASVKVKIHRARLALADIRGEIRP
jgi:RNA polymerase sigma-70 factor (ECF subfamily)